MTEHRIAAVHEGQPVTVVLRWNHLNDEYFMHIEPDPVEDGNPICLYASPTLYDDGVIKDLPWFEKRLQEFGIQVPEMLFTQLAYDRSAHIVYRSLQYAEDGSYEEFNPEKSRQESAALEEVIRHIKAQVPRPFVEAMFYVEKEYLEEEHPSFWGSYYIEGTISRDLDAPTIELAKTQAAAVLTLLLADDHRDEDCEARSVRIHSVVVKDDLGKVAAIGQVHKESVRWEAVVSTDVVPQLRAQSQQFDLAAQDAARWDDFTNAKAQRRQANCLELTAKVSQYWDERPSYFPNG
jgi:hypothetical protein